jgi:hypothetical protein
MTLMTLAYASHEDYGENGEQEVRERDRQRAIHWKRCHGLVDGGDGGWWKHFFEEEIRKLGLELEVM